MTMRVRNYFLVSVFIGCLAVTCKGSICQNDTCISCGTTEDPLQLECPDGEVITGIPEAGFRSNVLDNDCVYKEGDCICAPKMSGPEIRKPMWKSGNAELTFQYLKFPFMLERGNCPEAHTQNAYKYLIIRKHRCVPESHIHSLCEYEPQTLIAEEGISKQIISPGFMDSYIKHTESNEDQSKCTVNITASNSNYGIHLSSIFVEIKDARILITDFDNERQWDFNGGELEIHSSKVNIQFSYEKRGNEVNNKTGFAIEYSSFLVLGNSTEKLITEAPTTTTEASTTSLPHIPDMSSTSSGTQPDTTLSEKDSKQSTDSQPPSDLPTVVLAFVIIACIIFIIFVVIAVGFIIFKYHKFSSEGGNIKNFEHDYADNIPNINGMDSASQQYYGDTIHNINGIDSASQFGDMASDIADSSSVYTVGTGNM